jgi:putative nucleotidyltransferase with HDIG domain
MKVQATTTPSEPLPAQWWLDPSYEGELYIPGQATLSAAGRDLLEEMAAKVDQGNISIPPMPTVAMEIVKLMRRPDADIDDIADKIKLDAAMTVQVLRYANSALFGPRQVIDSIHHAASYLGTKRLKNVILEAALRKLSGDIKAEAYARMEWTYSLTAATIARAMAQRLKFDLENCYLAGLLHDIGRLPLLQELEKLGRLSDEPTMDDDVDIIVETLHRGVGRQVAQSWDLPPAITDAIGSHLTGRLEDEDSLAQFDSTRVAEAAGDLCIAMGRGRFRRPFDLLNAPSLVDLGFNRRSLDEFLGQDLPPLLEEVGRII